MLNFFLNAAEGPGTQGGGLGGLVSLLPLVLIFVVMYFLMIRPQKKQEKEAQNMRDNLSVGDEITTIGGIIGKVLKVKDDKVCIEIGDRTSKHPMTIKREAVASVVPCKKAKKEKDVELIEETAEETPAE